MQDLREGCGTGTSAEDTAPADALVLFGTMGDLAHKKIFPALYHMVQHGHLDVPVIGVARAGRTNEHQGARARQHLAIRRRDRSKSLGEAAEVASHLRLQHQFARGGHWVYIAAAVSRGFVRDSDGTIITVDPQASMGTVASSINEASAIVGLLSRFQLLDSRLPARSGWHIRHIHCDRGAEHPCVRLRADGQTRFVVALQRCGTRQRRIPHSRRNPATVQEDTRPGNDRRREAQIFLAP
jgi:hypothetical protein